MPSSIVESQHASFHNQHIQTEKDISSADFNSVITTFTLATNQHIHSTGTVKLHFRLDNHVFAHHFHIMFNLSHPIIIGIDFLRKFGLKIDFATFTCTFSNQRKDPLSLQRSNYFMSISLSRGCSLLVNKHLSF